MAASSSRRSVVEGLLALAGIGALGIWRAGAAEVRPPHDPGDGARSPRLVLRRRTPPDATRTPASDGVRLALATLPPGARAALVDGLAVVVDVLEARMHPLGIDLDDQDPEAIMEPARAALLPIVNAAQALLAPRWRAGDGSLSVEAVAARAADAAMGDRLLPAWPAHASGDREAAQARFLAWPVTSALLARCASAADASRAAAALRDAAMRPGTSVGLVVDASTLDGTPLPETAELRALGRRGAKVASRAARTTAVELLLALAAGPTSGVRMPWLELDPGELLVVPRMSALSRRRTFVEEARAAVGASPRLLNG